MPKKPPHLYLELAETHRRLKAAAAQLGATITALVQDAIEELLRDIDDVPPGTVGADALRFLRDLRRRRRDHFKWRS